MKILRLHRVEYFVNDEEASKVTGSLFTMDGGQLAG